MSSNHPTVRQNGAAVRLNSDVGDLRAHVSADVSARDADVAKIIESLSVGVEHKGKGTSFEYSVNKAADAHKVRVTHKTNIQDKDVELRIDASSNGKNVLRAKVAIDSSNSVALAHTLGGAQAVTLSHQHNDTRIEPTFCLGSQSLSLALTHQVDSQNEAKLSFDQGSNQLGLGWNHILEDGREIRVNASNIDVARLDVNDLAGNISAEVRYAL